MKPPENTAPSDGAHKSAKARVHRIDNRVSFRLPGPLALELAERAQDARTSTGALAKRLVAEALLDPPRNDRLTERIQTLETRVAELQNGLALSFASLLLNLTPEGRFDATDVREEFEDLFGVLDTDLGADS